MAPDHDNDLPDIHLSDPADGKGIIEPESTDSLSIKPEWTLAVRAWANFWGGPDAGLGEATERSADVSEGIWID